MLSFSVVKKKNVVMFLFDSTFSTFCMAQSVRRWDLWVVEVIWDCVLPYVRHFHSRYGIFHCGSIKYDLMLHWITMKYAVSIRKCLTYGTAQSLQYIAGSSPVAAGETFFIFIMPFAIYEGSNNRRVSTALKTRSQIQLTKIHCLFKPSCIYP